ncbi:MAG: flagellar hook-basal body complex protein FliE [Clostridiaceae bacterium]|nr:flagellar hook-basal body complex protein FliE [Clostridiaceae bacterium]
MAVSSVTDINFDNYFDTPVISSSLATETDSLLVDTEDQSAFDSILDSAVQLISETNAYSNAAEEEELKFATGETDSIHDVMIAQQKANVSLQYTVAVRDAFVTAYKEIMNLQM